MSGVRRLKLEKIVLNTKLRGKALADELAQTLNSQDAPPHAKSKK